MVQIDPELFIQLFSKCPEMFDSIEKEITVIDTEHLDQWYNDEWYNKDKQFFTKERYNKIVWWITEGYKDFIENKPPYKITKKQNKDNNKFHWELWSVDEMRNTIEVLASEVKKKDLNIHIKKIISWIIVIGHLNCPFYRYK